jgi:cytochrome c oxidase cbb3-type subunit 2
MIGLNALFHRRPEAILGLGGGVFLLLSWLIALGPALDFEAADAARPPQPLDPVIARGRALYLAEGCGYCHSQFVRPLFIDVPYGRPSEAADFADAAPPLLGTERNGPDLSDVGSRQPSAIWNLSHLFNPRSVVPESVMPGFPWYFQIVDRDDVPAGATVLALPPPFLPPGKVALPRPQALDLTAYLLSLRQAPVSR